MNTQMKINTHIALFYFVVFVISVLWVSIEMNMESIVGIISFGLMTLNASIWGVATLILMQIEKMKNNKKENENG